MITSLRLTLLFSVATQMHASLFLSRLRYCIQRGVYPRLLSFQKLEFLGPFLMHWTDNTWPYFIIWWLGSFLQKDWLHLLEFQTLYPMLRLGAKHPCHPNLLENFGILEFFKSLNGHMYTSKKKGQQHLNHRTSGTSPPPHLDQCHENQYCNFASSLLLLSNSSSSGSVLSRGLVFQK